MWGKVMIKFKSKVLAVTAVCMAVMMSGCVSIRYAKRLETTVAEIKGEKILLNNVDGQINNMLDNIEFDYGPDFEDEINRKIKKTDGEEKKQYEGKKQALIDNRKKALESLINVKVLELKAKQNKLNIDKEMKAAEETLKQLKEKEITTYKNQGMSEDEAEKEYKKNEKSVIGRYYGEKESTRADFMKSHMIAAYADKMKEKIRDSIDVTDEDIKKYYDDNKSQYVFEAGYEVKELFFPIIDGNEDEAYHIADETFFSMAEGNPNKTTDFSTVYFNASNKTDELSKEGKMIAQENRVAFKNSNRPELYMKYMKNMGEGQFCSPIYTDKGYYIVYIECVRPKDIIRTLDHEKNDIREKLKDKRKDNEVKEKIEEYKKEFKVKIYEDKLSF